DVVEAGFPVSSGGDFEAVQRIAREVSGPVVAAMARTSASDIETTWKALRDADQARIHLFLATSPIHMEHKLRMTPEEVLTAVKTSVTQAREYTEDVEYTPEDATRSDPDFLLAVCHAAVDAGATTLNIPDTVGYATPVDYGKLIARVVEEVKGSNEALTVSTHCHNDLGLAVANSLAAVDAGARQVEVAVNGIGERAGNTSLEEAVMALTVRADAFSVETSINTRELYATSQLVSRETGYPVQYNKAIVGRNAFAHESGIHQHGVLRNRATYEIMDPASVGHTGRNIVMGKHSGRAAFKHSLATMGLDLNPALFEKAFMQLKVMADHQGEVSETQMKWIVDNVTSGVESFEGVAESFR
ncbi:MAG: 2-isopropylmalate synthase, partial [Acidimicrobiia bacterium]|nr:2-isopropylmalate synthase [Acidimicrobiia bacterium]